MEDQEKANYEVQLELLGKKLNILYEEIELKKRELGTLIVRRDRYEKLYFLHQDIRDAQDKIKMQTKDMDVVNRHEVDMCIQRGYQTR